MAEHSNDHPAFSWLMRFMESGQGLNPEQTILGEEQAPSMDPGQWVVSDGSGIVATGSSVDSAMETLNDQALEHLAIAFLRINPVLPGDRNSNSSPLAESGSGTAGVSEERRPPRADES